MAADLLGKQQVRTDANNDVKVQVADGTTENQLLSIDVNGAVKTKAHDGAGNALSSTSGALHIHLESQATASVKVSRDTSANAVGNPIFVELSDGAAALGTAANPVRVLPLEAVGGSAIKSYDKAAAVAGNGGSANHDYVVTAAKTLTLSAITVSAGVASRFDVILDAAGTPETLDTFYIPASGGTCTKDYSGTGITLSATKTIRITKVNNEKAVGATADLYSSIQGNEA